MSVPGTGSIAGLPAVNQALEPTWVRRGSPSTQQAYETALAFEQTLVEQISQSLTDTSGAQGESQEGEAGSQAGGAPSSGAGGLSSLLPQALAGSIAHAGGLGLAAQLTHELADSQTAEQARAAGGTPPHAGGGTSIGVSAVTPNASAAPVQGGGGTAV